MQRKKRPEKGEVRERVRRALSEAIRAEQAAGRFPVFKAPSPGQRR